MTPRPFWTRFGSLYCAAREMPATGAWSASASITPALRAAVIKAANTAAMEEAPDERDEREERNARHRGGRITRYFGLAPGTPVASAWSTDRAEEQPNLLPEESML